MSRADRISVDSPRVRRNTSVLLTVLLHLLALVVWSRWPESPTWTPPVSPLPLEPYVKQPLPELAQRPLVRQRASERSAAGAVAAAPAPARSRDLAGLPVPALRASTVQVEALSLPLVEPVARIGPSLRAGAVGGGRGSAEQVDLSMEMLGVEALDTGRHRALVVVDPKDRRGMKGFLYLSGVRSASIEGAESIGRTNGLFGGPSSRSVAAAPDRRSALPPCRQGTGVAEPSSPPRCLNSAGLNHCTTHTDPLSSTSDARREANLRRIRVRSADGDGPGRWAAVAPAGPRPPGSGGWTPVPSGPR